MDGMGASSSAVLSKESDDGDPPAEKPQAFKPSINWNTVTTRHAIRTNLRGSRTPSLSQPVSAVPSSDPPHSTSLSILSSPESSTATALKMATDKQTSPTGSHEPQNALSEDAQTQPDPTLLEAQPQSASENALGDLSSLPDHELPKTMPSGQPDNADLPQIVSDSEPDQPRGESWSNLIRKAWSGLSSSSRQQQAEESSTSQVPDVVETVHENGSDQAETGWSIAAQHIQPPLNVKPEVSDADLLQKQLEEEETRMDAANPELSLRHKEHSGEKTPIEATGGETTTSGVKDDLSANSPDSHTSLRNAQLEIPSSDDDGNNVVLNLVEDDQDADLEPHKSASSGDIEELGQDERANEPHLFEALSGDGNIRTKSSPQASSPNSQLDVADNVVKEDDDTNWAAQGARPRPVELLSDSGELSEEAAESEAKDVTKTAIPSDAEEGEIKDESEDNDLVDVSEDGEVQESGSHSEEEADIDSDSGEEEGEISDSEQISDSEEEEDALATEYSNANRKPQTAEPKSTEHQVEIIDLSSDNDEPEPQTPEVLLGQGPKILADLTPEQLELQVRYFYVSRDPKTIPETDPVHCTICTKPGHMDKHCPSRVCVNCKTWDSHFVDLCPERARCSRCRGAHKLADCTLKLKPINLVLICDLCNEEGHDEDDCELRWRTSGRIWEKPLPPLSVARHCYECGISGHLGNDCPSRRPGKPMGSSMWSERGLPQPMPSLSAVPGVSIPGPKKQPNKPNIPKGPSGGPPQNRGQTGMKIKGLASSTQYNPPPRPNKRPRSPSPDSPIHLSDSDSVNDTQRFLSNNRAQQMANRNVSGNAPAASLGGNRGNQQYAPVAPVMRFSAINLPKSQIIANAAAARAAEDRPRGAPPAPPPTRREPIREREYERGYERSRDRDRDRDRDYYDRDRDRDQPGYYDTPTSGGRFRDFRDERHIGGGPPAGRGRDRDRDRRSRSPQRGYDRYEPSGRRW